MATAAAFTLPYQVKRLPRKQDKGQSLSQIGVNEKNEFFYDSVLKTVGMEPHRGDERGKNQFIQQNRPKIQKCNV